MIWERKKCSYYSNDLRPINLVIKHLLKAYYEPGSLLEVGIQTLQCRKKTKKRAMKCFNCYIHGGPKKKKYLTGEGDIINGFAEEAMLELGLK